MAIQPLFDPNNPIPNLSFYAPDNTYLISGYGGLILGDGLLVTNGVISAAGAGVYPSIVAGAGITVSESMGVVTVNNSGVISIAAGNGISLTKINDTYTITNTSPAPSNYGTVTKVSAGAGLTGGPITTSGTLALSPVPTIAPGTYPYATITVDQYGRVTLASPGQSPQSIQGTGAISVTSTVPQIVSVASGSTTTEGVVRLNNTTTSTSTAQAATAGAVKVTFDLATAAQSAANSAGAAAGNALSAANAAQATANAASTAANSAVATANSAQSDATTALSTANSAQSDATQALTDAGTALAAANNAQSTANSKISCSTYAAKGQVLVGTGSGTFVALNPGINGQHLIVNSSTASGLAWAPAGEGTVTSILTGVGLTGGPITEAGTLALANTSVIPGTYTYPTLTVDAQGRLTAASDGDTPVTDSFFTAQGQLLTSVAAANPYALDPGTNGQYLRVKTSALSGLAWEDSQDIPLSTVANKGSIPVGSTGGVVGLPVGSNGQVLLADSTQTTGLRWGSTCQGTVTSITTTGGITGGPITTTGSISLTNTGVTPGVYASPTVTVDAKGRVTAIVAGAPSSVTVTAPLTNTGTAQAAILGIDLATTVTPGVVKIGSNIDYAGGTISLKNASTLQKGLVTLNDTLTSNSNALALTANQGRILKETIDNLETKSGIIIAGTYNPSLREMETLTAAGIAAGFVIGQDIPTAALSNKNYFVIATSDETYTPPGGGPGAPYALTQGDWLLSSGSAWQAIDAGKDIFPATTTTEGVTRFATLAETATGSLDNVATTPAGVASAYVPSALLTAPGDIITRDASNTLALPVGPNLSVLMSCTACTTGLVWSSEVVDYSQFSNKGILLSAIGAGQPTAVAPGTENQYLVVCGACPTGLAWATLAPNNSIPCSEITAKGDILIGNAPGVPAALPVGTSGQILSANPGCLNGLEWCTYVNDAIPCACLPNKGDLVTGQGAGVLGRVGVGLDGQVLKACSACATGLYWDADGAGGGIPCALLQGQGQIIVATAANSPAALPVGADGVVLTADSTAAEGVAWCALPATPFIPCSALTDKGYLVTSDGANNPLPLGPGTDGQVLKSCSTCASGLFWDTIAFPQTDIPCSIITGQGTLIVGSSVNQPSVLETVGNQGYILQVDENSPVGISWRDQDDGTFIRNDLVEAKGDLIVGSAAGAAASLTAGPDGYVLRSCTTAPNGVVWDTEAPNLAIPCAILQGKGDIVAATAAGQPVALPTGAEGYVLRVSSAAASGLAWTPDGTGDDVPCSAFLVKGDILAASDANTPTALSIGSEGQILKVCSLCTTGLAWADEAVTADIPCSLLTARGQIIVAAGPNAPVAFPIGADSQVLKACNLCAYGVYWADDATGQEIPCSIITNKGQLIVGCASGIPLALDPGTTGYVLKSNPATPTGLEWGPDSSGDSIQCSLITGKGTLIVGSGPSVPAALAIGPDDSFLVADSNSPTGVNWTSAPPAPPATPISDGSLTGSTTNDSTFLGCSAGISNAAIENVRNIGIGQLALSETTNLSGENLNVAIGVCALTRPACSLNVAIGHKAGYSVPDNNALYSSSILVGENAGMASSTAGVESAFRNSIAIGQAAQCGTQLSCFSIAIGGSAIGPATSSCFDVALGSSALNVGINGVSSNNIAIGCRAMSNLSGKSGGSRCNDIAIGRQAGDDPLRFLSDNVNNNVVLGNFSTERISIKVAPVVTQDVATQAVLSNIDATLASCVIRNLNVRKYRLCDPGTGTCTDTIVRYGFDGQEIRNLEQAVIPGQPGVIAIEPGDGEYYAVDNNALLGAAINTLQTALTTIDNLQTCVASLQTQIDNLTP